MRRTGRTTQLIIKAISELLSEGGTDFVDHHRYDGKAYPREHYLHLTTRFMEIIAVVLSISLKDVDRNYSFNALLNGQGLRIDKKGDRMVLKALMTIGEK